MVAPPAELIEAAQDQLQVLIDSKATILDHQEQELRGAFGQDEWEKKITLDSDFIMGYHLGLQVARTMIATNVTIQQKGVIAENIL